MPTVLEKLGSRVRLAVIGGGEGAFIGETHRMASRLDDAYELVAAAVSSNSDKALWPQRALDVAPDRCYADWRELIRQESSRPDGAEVIAVMTPNDSHADICITALHAGFHVICDKPLGTTLEQAQAVAQAVDETGRLLCLTHCYSSYPLVRQAREMVKTGLIGEVLQVQLLFTQGHMTQPGEPRKSWKQDPQRSGASLILIDIGTHAHHLGAYVTGLTVDQVCADVGAVVPGRQVDDYASALLKFNNGAKGTFWVTQAAAGCEHGLSFRVHGTLAGLEWQQENPNVLHYRPIKGYAQTITRRLDQVSDAARASTRLAIGHPEAYIEAFANLYTDFAFAVRAYQQQTPCPPEHAQYPTAQDGVDGLRFVHAAIASSQQGQWVSLV